MDAVYVEAVEPAAQASSWLSAMFQRRAEKVKMMGNPAPLLKLLADWSATSPENTPGASQTLWQPSVLFMSSTR